MLDEGFVVRGYTGSTLVEELRLKLACGSAHQHPRKVLDGLEGARIKLAGIEVRRLSQSEGKAVETQGVPRTEVIVSVGMHVPEIAAEFNGVIAFHPRHGVGITGSAAGSGLG